MEGGRSSPPQHGGHYRLRSVWWVWLLLVVLFEASFAEAEPTGVRLIAPAIHRWPCESIAAPEVRALRWTSGSPTIERGDFVDPFDWVWFVAEMVPRGDAVVTVLDPAGTLHELPWSADEAAFEVEPTLPERMRGRYRSALALRDAWGATARAWESVLEAALDPSSESFVAFQAGESALRYERASDAVAFFQRALERAADPRAQALTWGALGRAHAAAGDVRAATEAHERALSLWSIDPGRNALLRAESYDRIATLKTRDGAFKSATPLFVQALELRRRHAPQTLEVVRNLTMLAYLHWQRGDLLAAIEAQDEGLALAQRVVPDHLFAARAALNLGTYRAEQGSFSVAAELLEAALASGRLPPREQTYVHNNLGRIYLRQGDHRRATRHLDVTYEAIVEETDWESDEKLALVLNLAELAKALGRGAMLTSLLDTAEAVVADEELVRLSVRAMNTMATLHQLTGGAQEMAWLRRAVERGATEEPNSLETAIGCHRLGTLLVENGERARGTAHLERALAIWEHLAPGTLEHAGTLAELARAARSSGDIEAARNYYQRALTAIEQQSQKVHGNPDARAEFRAEFKHLYDDLIDLLVDSGETAAAFDVLERLRAQTFLRMLAERDLEFASELPAEMRSERRRLRRSYDELQARAAGFVGDDEGALAALRQEMLAVQDRRSSIIERTRRASPRLARLRYPRALGFEAAQQALEQGTLLVSFSVSPERTRVFCASGRGELTTYRVPIRSTELRRRIEDFVALVADKRRDHPLLPPPTPRDAGILGDGLFELLFGPIRAQLRDADRVVVLPDGPLHLVPFSALSYPQEEGRRYLVEDLPIHVAPSVTVYAELQRAAPRTTPLSVIAFGDPQREPDRSDGTADPSSGPIDGTTSRSLPRTPLPFSRREVERIESVYGAESVAIYLGSSATEEAARSLDASTSIVHFATHGVVDERTPLDSALVLADPGVGETTRENGLLQAWEIFEDVRLEADLVVLSACESALGKEVEGEGLIGLTRAFLYAGSRSVVATLWKVADDTTAELMVRFHQNLRDGLEKDEALRQAQIAFIRDPVQMHSVRGRAYTKRVSDPYYWAAFQLYGAWR